ncbi:LemA family protein [Patescibacteria group bacterium]
MSNVIFVIIGVLVLLMFLFSISVIHIRALRDEINVRWYNLVDKLQYRQDLFPVLIETARLFITKNADEFETMVKDTVAVRARAGKNTKASMQKVVVEHDFSRHLKEILQFSEQIDELRINTNYLEVKKHLHDISKDLENLATDYNKKVRNHNKVIKRFYNALPATLLGYKKRAIFEFE